MYKIVENVYDSVISFILLLAGSDFWKGTETVAIWFALILLVEFTLIHVIDSLLIA